MGGKTTLTKFMGARLDSIIAHRAIVGLAPTSIPYNERDIKTQAYRGRDTMGMFYLDMRGVPLNFIIF